MNSSDILETHGTAEWPSGPTAVHAESSPVTAPPTRPQPAARRTRRSLRVSVVIPAFAAERTIEAALDSVLAQTYPACEILVIDDGSPVPLADQLHRYGHRVRCIRQTNGGAAAARNRGLQLASGDLVAFLDADDQWTADKLQRAVEVFATRPDVQFVASRYRVQDTETGTVSFAGPPPEQCGRALRTAPRDLLVRARSICTPALVARREFLQDRPFDSTLTTAEDRDLWIRMLLDGTGYFLAEPLVTVRLRGNSLSHGDIDTDSRCMLRVLRRYARQLGPLQCLRERAYVQYKWAAGSGMGGSAWRRLAISFLLWPLPFAPRRSGCWFPRLRFAGGLIRRRLLAR